MLAMSHSKSSSRMPLLPLLLTLALASASASHESGLQRVSASTKNAPLPKSARWATRGLLQSPSSGAGLCSDACFTSQDLECDDGGPGSAFVACGLGDDCADCGPRVAPAPPPPAQEHEIAADGAVINPSDEARTYSSVIFNDKRGTAHARSMLDSPQAWSTAVLDLLQYVEVCA